MENDKEEITQPSPRSAIEKLSKEELIIKYKGVLGLAKKAKEVRDEYAEENRKLKDALESSDAERKSDKNDLEMLKEMVEQFTEHKLQMATELSELHRKKKFDDEKTSNLEIENQSLKRQLKRLYEENDALLKHINESEEQLKQVNLLGIEQKEHLTMLELQVNKLKEAENENKGLQEQLAKLREENRALAEKENATNANLEELRSKYNVIKDVNAEHRRKFNSLKDRFVEVYRNLKIVKECKRILLQTQYEYSEAVSHWQAEIVEASTRLCSQIAMLRRENHALCAQMRASTADTVMEKFAKDIIELQLLVERACVERDTFCIEMEKLKKENDALKCRNVDRREEYGDDGDCDDEVMEEEQTKTMLKNSTLDFTLNSNMIRAVVTKLGKCKENLSCECLNILAKENKDFCKNVNLMKTLMMENERLRQELMAAIGESPKIVDVAQTTTIHMTVDDSRQPPAGEHEAIELLDLRAKYSLCMKTNEEYRLRYERKEQEHSDLLAEMRELNEALKGRGDVISRQQESQQELVAQMTAMTARLKHIENSIQQKNVQLDDKEMEVRAIREEIERASATIAMLESTCSQNEKKMRSLTEELLRQRQGVEVTVTATATAASASAASDVASSETLSTSTFSRNDELGRMRDVDESIEEKYNKLRSLAIKLRKKLQEQTAYIAELEEARVNMAADLEDRKKTATTLQDELKQSVKVVETQKAEMQKLKKSSKQNNVLSLEMEAVEKTLSETTTKLKQKTEEMRSLTETLSLKDERITQLGKEIDLLEMTRKSECQHAENLREEMKRLQSQLKEAAAGKQQALDATRDAEIAGENVKLDLERLKMEFATDANKCQADVLDMRTRMQESERSLQQLEEEHRGLQMKYKTQQHVLEDLRVEYLDYKVKAQAVLRRSQNKDSQREREQEEELLVMRARERQLEATVDDLTKKIDGNECSMALFKEDHNRMQKRWTDVNGLVEQLKQQNEALLQENRLQMQKYQESLKCHRIQIEDLEVYHKNQLDEMKKHHHSALETLRNEQSQRLRKPLAIGGECDVQALPLPSSDGSSGGGSTIEHNRIDVLIMEREDAEGSEEAEAFSSSTTTHSRKISSASHRSQHDFMPLDELLNVPMTAIGDTVMTTTIGDGDNATIAGLSNTKEHLKKHEIQVRHLTALLADNEQDLARLRQMNEMLKEELRRQERTEEREKHMHNSEYLKNIIIKFLTLNNVDERMRLVPVLNTILKLNRNETEMLTCVAKGQRGYAEATNRGNWTNYLPSWGGGN